MKGKVLFAVSLCQNFYLLPKWPHTFSSEDNSIFGKKLYTTTFNCFLDSRVQTFFDIFQFEAREEELLQDVAKLLS